MPKSAKTKYPEVKEIKNDLESLKENTVELAKHVKEDGIEQAQEKAQSISAAAKKNLRKAEIHVKQNPIQSVAVAFAGGVIASMLLGGRR